MFSSREEKKKHLSSPNLLTSAFAHVAVALLYRLDNLTLHSSGPLRLTPDILAGIFDGSIEHWNHSAIQAANEESKQSLPFLRIRPVVRSVPSDTNSIFLRYLSKNPSFKAAYPNAIGTDYRYVDFTTRIDPNYLVHAKSNSDVDSSVRYFDGALGYYILVDMPNSEIAHLCTTSGTCTENVSMDPSDEAQSIHVLLITVYL